MISLDEQAIKRTFFYTPFNFLRTYENALVQTYIAHLNDDIANDALQTFGIDARWFMRFLKWDSTHFSCPTYRLEFADWDKHVADPATALANTLMNLKLTLANQHAQYYLFAEIPSEDTVALQAMGLAGFKLIETRLTYFSDNLKNFTWPERFQIRPATKADIPHLRNVAMTAVNLYDRYHADPFFTRVIANEYLATFVENSINGFADVVLIPKEDEQLPNAFFTAHFISPKDSGLDINIARIVLVAVNPERSGWHLKLFTEMTYYFQQMNMDVACMTTQSTNRAVIRNCEKLGYRYGRSTHLYAFNLKIQPLMFSY